MSNDDALEAAIQKQILVELLEHDMTQEDLAEKLGTTPATLNRYIKGHRSMPMSTFFKVADALGLSQVELLQRAVARLGK
ncbi:helix-turn-helix domain-containing protein [Sinomonas susongensis]|uniref:helix-turn-helix domain-containing protein n=1 Tax=Sinomonas susongensis TaxID=1324851 RepID=UPI001108056A|nr:helix-turn-helix transcriptional regulator [Sinomonas susongensis]